MMTTTDSVVLWQAGSRAAVFAVLACLGTTLAGCGSTNILGSNSSTATPSPALAAAPKTPQAPPPVSQSRVALAPVVGAPDAIGKQLSGLLSQSLNKSRVLMVSGTEKPDYTLRGYMVAAKDKAGVKVSYIWDLTDPAGKRANRIQGEEIARGANSSKPWSALNAPMMQTIADKTASSLSTSLASLAPTIARTTAPVGVGAPARTAAAPATGPTTGSIARPATPAARQAATSARSGVIVPIVRGAPGDGNTALMTAMRQQLQSSGLATAAPGQSAYKVAGRVKMGAPKGGKQSIKIDWQVFDPAGQEVATVTQNNEIQAGLLNKKWGATANDAAQGAAVKIKSLFQQNKTAQAATGSRQVARR